MTQVPRMGQVLDELDRPVPGATINVYDINGNDAVLTSDGVTSLLQPLTTDEFGNYSYYALVGYYREDTSYAGKLRYREDNIALGNPGADLNLRTDLAAPTGSGLVGATAPNGAATLVQRHIVRNYVDDISGFVTGSGGNPATNTAAFNAAVAANPAHYRVRGGDLVKIGASLNLPSNSGLNSESGNRPTILMPAANFTNTDNVGNRYGTNSVGINFSGQSTGPYTPTSGVVLENFILQSETTIGRYLRGIVGLNINKCRISGVEVFGIPTGVGICLASATRCLVEQAFVHDFTDSTNWASLPQLTAIEIDNDQVNSIASDDVAIERFRIENLTVSGALLTTWGYQTDGINVCNKEARVRIRGGRINGVGEGIDHFGRDSIIDDVSMDNIYQYGLKFIHGASRNQANNIVVTNTGLAAVLFAGSNAANRDTEANVVRGISCRFLDPNNVWVASNSAGVLITDNVGTAGKPRNNQVNGSTIDPGPNGDYGWLDSSTGSRNFGTGFDCRDRAQLQKKVLVQNGAGAVQVKGSNSWHTALDPSTVPVPRNTSRPAAGFPYVVGQFEEIVSVLGAGARTILIPPGWSGKVKDGGGNAAAGNITIQGVPAVTAANGSFAIDADGQGTVTVTAANNPIYEGMTIAGAGVTAGMVVGEQLTGARFGIGIYRVNHPLTLAATAITFGSPGTIDGAASAVINANYGHVELGWSDGAGNGWGLV